MRKQDELCNDMLKLIAFKDQNKFRNLLTDYSLVMMRIGKELPKKDKIKI